MSKQQSYFDFIRLECFWVKQPHLEEYIDQADSVVRGKLYIRS